MGYKREAKAYQLKFADGSDMDGFEAKMRRLSAKQFLKLTGAAAGLIGLNTKDPVAVAQAAPLIGDMFAMVGDGLLEWNLEDDDDKPVPASRGNVEDQDFDFVLALAMAWMEAIGGVAPPLPASSNGTARLQEASIPMDVLSPSRSS